MQSCSFLVGSWRTERLHSCSVSIWLWVRNTMQAGLANKTFCHECLRLAVWVTHCDIHAWCVCLCERTLQLCRSAVKDWEELLAWDEGCYSSMQRRVFGHADSWKKVQLFSFTGLLVLFGPEFWLCATHGSALFELRDGFVLNLQHWLFKGIA